MLAEKRKWTGGSIFQHGGGPRPLRIEEAATQIDLAADIAIGAGSMSTVGQNNS